MWSLEIYNLNDVTPTWETDLYADGSAVKFPSSTQEISQDTISNSTFVKLYDGDEAKVTPEVEFIKGDIKFNASPLTVTDEMISKLQGYTRNTTGIRITTHTGEVFEGYIKNINKNYKMTGLNQLYTLVITLKQFDVDGSGDC